ncbi:hypothetical protein HZS_1858 [Henneguya salminicola]|nr:hypothetical protein HZS_1858 [Henneguya salminicola]
MIRQQINFLLTLPSNAAHLIIPEKYKIKSRKGRGKIYSLCDTWSTNIFLVRASTFTLIPPISQFLKFSISCFLFA